MAIEIVSFPMKNGGSFHSYVNVYQRVDRWFQLFQDFAGPSTIAAIMVESIPGSAGVLIPAVGFMEGWSGVRRKVWALVCS
jgi:acetylornithine/succinyldiaminopimelate/putrescine aminotransferase